MKSPSPFFLSIIITYSERKINISEKEVTDGMINYASQYPGQEKQIFEYFKKNPSSIETIRGPILEEKVVKYICSQSSLIKTKLDKDAFEKLEKKVFDVKKDK